MTDLAQVLADLREEAAVLRRNGASFSVERVEAVADAVRDAAEEWLTWLSETDAAVRTGYSIPWLRARYDAWERDGHARTVSRARQYRACVLPRRANTAVASAKGRAAAREIRRAS